MQNLHAAIHGISMVAGRLWRSSQENDNMSHLRQTKELLPELYARFIVWITDSDP
jgi:hypothetical protein